MTYEVGLLLCTEIILLSYEGHVNKTSYMKQIVYLGNFTLSYLSTNFVFRIFQLFSWTVIIFQIWLMRNIYVNKKSKEKQRNQLGNIEVSYKPKKNKLLLFQHKKVSN